jgi:hypothetical protein
MQGEVLIRHVQNEAVKMNELLEEVQRHVKQLLAVFPEDVEDVPDEMVLWEQCPSTDFYMHGLLSVLVSELEEIHQCLQEAAATTPESIREKWVKIRATDMMFKELGLHKKSPIN